MATETLRSFVVLGVGIVLLLAFEGGILLHDANLSFFVIGAIAVGVLTIAQIPDLLRPRA